LSSILDDDLDQVNISHLCEGLQASIIGDRPGDTEEGAPAASHLYLVKCIAKNLAPWEVAQPYHKFRATYDGLVAQGVDMTEAPIPRKHFFRRGGDDMVVEERRAALKAIVNRFCEVRSPEGEVFPEVVRFLQVGKGAQGRASHDEFGFGTEGAVDAIRASQAQRHEGAKAVDAWSAFLDASGGPVGDEGLVAAALYSMDLTDKAQAACVRHLFWGGVPPTTPQADGSCIHTRRDAYLACARRVQRIPTARYEALLEMAAQGHLPQELEEQIQKDLPRTFEDANTVQGFHDKLGRVLRAYALQDPTVGYCQGLNFIAGFLLFFFEESDVFEMVAVLSGHLFPGYFVQSMMGIRVDMMSAVELLKVTDAPLYEHLNEMIPAELILQGPLQTLLIEELPPSTVLRVMDTLFLSALHLRGSFPTPYAVLIFANLIILEKARPHLLELEPFEAGAIKEITHDLAATLLDADRLLAQVELKMAAYGELLPELRLTQMEAHRNESEMIVQRSQRKAALLSGMEEADFDELYRRFEQSESHADGTMVVDRGGLNVEEFAQLMQELNLPHIAEHPELVFGLVDMDGNGRVSLKELVAAFTALRAEATPQQRLKWAFEMFDKDSSQQLGIKELQDMVQFFCIMNSMQHAPSNSPVVWEAQRWYPTKGWLGCNATRGFSVTGGVSFADEHGDGVVPPCPNFGWGVRSNTHDTGEDGWKYAAVLPAHDQLHSGAYNTSPAIGNFVRWRAYENKLPKQIIAKIGSHKFRYEQLEQAVETHFPVLHAAFDPGAS